jgi:hypothetical protein
MWGAGSVYSGFSLAEHQFDRLGMLDLAIYLYMNIFF